MNLKIVVAVVILFPIVAHLGFAVAVSPSANYYANVDEYLNQPKGASSARVGGTVVPGSINWDNATKTLHFQIAGDYTRADVVFKGPVPDSFRDGVTAILEASQGTNGVLVARNIMVKCPHQYLPAG